MATTYEAMMRRINAAKGNKELWRSMHDECYDFFLPQKNLYNDRESGQQKDEKVFDSTAQDALADYASRMESQIVPPGRQWMKLEAGTDVPEKEKDQVDGQLEKITEILFDNINSSNFSSQVNEAFLDLGISTGALIVEEGDGIQSSLRFRAVPLAELILERSQRGIVETVWRELKINAGDIPHIFPQIKMPDQMKKDVEEKPEADYEFIEGVALNADQKTYTSMVISVKDKKFLYEATEESSPWVVFRESTTAGEVFGRGRAMRCLSNVKTLNMLMRDYLSAVELWGNPTYLAVDDGVINPHTSSFKPRTINVVGAADSITALPVSGSPEISMDLIQRLQDTVRSTMLSKPFGNIEETPVRTATEMSIRNADLAETSQSASGRIQVELLERVIARCVFILSKAGKLPQFKVNGREASIKFTSPSAKIQDEVELAATLRFMEIMQSLPPELSYMTVKVEEIPAEIANYLGVSKKLLLTEQEQQQKKSEMQQQAAAQVDPNQGGQ